jgi:hypothetical protein
MALMALCDELDDWTDWDFAAYRLGRVLGLFGDADFIRSKHIFGTNNRLGNGLHDALLALVTAGVLERREEPDEQFRRPDDRDLR